MGLLKAIVGNTVAAVIILGGSVIVGFLGYLQDAPLYAAAFRSNGSARAALMFFRTSEDLLADGMDRLSSVVRGSYGAG